jgi:6-pyruvoyltetrahydropterin/6-carboxytetrahydropterin synthase
MIVYKHFTFDSAHFLPNLPENHPCKQLHGHTYHLTVFIEGEVDKDLGWVMDFRVLKQVVGSVLERVDHQLLNTIPGLENPTSETIVRWLWNEAKPKLPLLKRIELKETPSSGVVYEG